MPKRQTMMPRPNPPKVSTACPQHDPAPRTHHPSPIAPPAKRQKTTTQPAEDDEEEAEGEDDAEEEEEAEDDEEADEAEDEEPANGVDHAADAPVKSAVKDVPAVPTATNGAEAKAVAADA